MPIYEEIDSDISELIDYKSTSFIEDSKDEYPEDEYSDDFEEDDDTIPKANNTTTLQNNTTSESKSKRPQSAYTSEIQLNTGMSKDISNIIRGYTKGFEGNENKINLPLNFDLSEAHYSNNNIINVIQVKDGILFILINLTTGIAQELSFPHPSNEELKEFKHTDSFIIFKYNTACLVIDERSNSIRLMDYEFDKTVVSKQDLLITSVYQDNKYIKLNTLNLDSGYEDTLTTRHITKNAGIISTHYHNNKISIFDNKNDSMELHTYDLTTKAWTIVYSMEEKALQDNAYKYTWSNTAVKAIPVDRTKTYVNIAGYNMVDIKNEKIKTKCIHDGIVFITEDTDYFENGDLYSMPYIIKMPHFKSSSFNMTDIVIWDIYQNSDYSRHLSLYGWNKNLNRVMIKPYKKIWKNKFIIESTGLKHTIHYSVIDIPYVINLFKNKRGIQLIDPLIEKAIKKIEYTTSSDKYSIITDDKIIRLGDDSITVYM
jgi:hypothetical protein